MTLTLATTQTIAGIAGTAGVVNYTLYGDEVTTGVDDWRQLAQGQLTASAANLLAPSGKSEIVKTISLFNTSASPVTVAIYTGGLGTANKTWQATLPANGSAWYTADGWKVYDSAGFLQFVGATGPTGAQGIQGPQGPQGNPGTPGVITTVNTTAPLTGGGSSATLTLGIAANGIDASLMSQAPALTFRGNATGALANVQDLTATQATALLNPATQSLKGLLIASDKKLIDDLHYDVVADFGWIGDDSTDNGNGAGGATAFSAIMTALPLGARLFFPAGTYRTSVELTIGVDKRITFCGVNRYASIIKTTSTTANIFNKSVAGWYDTFMDLGFQSTVTKTAGSAIAITAGNNVGMNVYRIWVTGVWCGIDAQGAQSGNASIWADMDISGVPNTGRGIRINGSTINVMIHNSNINCGAATTSACVEINQSGAVQVTACDWIQGTNVLLFNSTTGAGPQACYFTNVFFDQPQGSVIKFTGGNTANRIKFTQCGIAPTGNNHGVEIAGTGAGGVGTQTALPGGISFVDCDIYCAVGTGTGAGIRVNGCQDINIQNSRITGFNGAGGAAIYATGSAGNVTKIRVNGCILGPNSNLTVLNETGVKLDGVAFGFLSVTDNSMLGCTTAINDTSPTLNTAPKNINNNQGAVSGFSAQATPGASVLTTVETVVMLIPLPPNSLKVGTIFKTILNYKPAAASIGTVRFRIGTDAVTPANNTALAALADSVTTANANQKFIVMQGGVQAVGGAGTFIANGISAATATVMNNSANVAASGSFNTAVQNYLMVTVANGTSTTTTVYSGSCEIISPS